MVFHELLLGACFSLVAFLVYLVIHYYRSYTTWSREGSRLPYIPFPRDCVFYPIQKSLTLQRFYNELAPHPIGGFYKMSRPYLLVRDPELARRILIKDFSHFVDHGFHIDEDLDPLNAHIFNLEGERWRAIRQKLTPIFSGAKMKAMWPLMMECEKVLTRHLDRLIESGTEFEVKDVMKKFAMDVIGTCAFGLRCDAIQNPESEFRKATETVLRESHIFFLRSLLRSMGLNLVALLKWKRIDKSVDDFFFSLVRECTKMRAKNQHTRNDIMQHLINLQHEEQEAVKKDNGQAEPLMTDSVVASQAFVFFVGGFETTSTTLSFVFYNLALHPEIMEKCRAEVKEVLQRHGGTMTYDSLKDMTYLQCVIDETLRVYPNVGWLERICQEPYELPDGSYTIKKKARLLLPIYAFHMDPKYFPNPERFDPDRFSDENKNNIVPGTYFPFGDGPRSCIGLRFARMEIKAAIASLIMRYDIEPSQKTDVPVQFAPTNMLISASNGIWLKWKKRNA